MTAGPGPSAQPSLRAIRREDITGLVLSGGLGRRMGGIEKGLQVLDGTPLARRALERLRPQVGPCLLNANRLLEQYAAWGVPVCPDPWPEARGPLAGMLAGLTQCTTPWLVAVPCDAPDFPLDLVDRLSASLRAEQRMLAMAATSDAGEPGALGLRAQPVFCMLHVELADGLRRHLEGGGRAVQAWCEAQGAVWVPFPVATDFENINTRQALAQRQLG